MDCFRIPKVDPTGRDASQEDNRQLKELEFGQLVDSKRDDLVLPSRYHGDQVVFIHYQERHLIKVRPVFPEVTEEMNLQCLGDVDVM